MLKKSLQMMVVVLVVVFSLQVQTASAKAGRVYRYAERTYTAPAIVLHSGDGITEVRLPSGDVYRYEGETFAPVVILYMADSHTRWDATDDRVIGEGIPSPTEGGGIRRD